MRMTNKSLMFRLRARVECMLIYKSENMWLQTPTVDTCGILLVHITLLSWMAACENLLRVKGEMSADVFVSSSSCVYQIKCVMWRHCGYTGHCTPQEYDPLEFYLHNMHGRLEWWNFSCSKWTTSVLIKTRNKTKSSIHCEWTFVFIWCSPWFVISTNRTCLYAYIGELSVILLLIARQHFLSTDSKIVEHKILTNICYHAHSSWLCKIVVFLFLWYLGSCEWIGIICKFSLHHIEPVLKWYYSKMSTLTQYYHLNAISK